MCSQKKNIAVLGGTSHIAKGLIRHFAADGDTEIFWFGRSVARMKKFWTENKIDSGKIHFREGYASFGEEKRFDVLVNCVGAGSPSHLGTRYDVWFTLTEEFDHLILAYLKNRNPEALYVNFSSGGIYGGDGSLPCSENAVLSICPNHIRVSDYYTIARLNSEAKHRAMAGLRIADLRIFAYFSRFADPDSGYFMTDVLRAVLENKPLKTQRSELVRDYISPDDLYRLIRVCMRQDSLNTALDAYSAAPVSKTEMLELFRKKFHLQVEFANEDFSSPNGTRNIYFSEFHRAGEYGYQPKDTSLAGLERELTYACGKKVLL